MRHHACIGLRTTRLTLRLTTFPSMTLLTLIADASGLDFVLVLRDILRRDGRDLGFAAVFSAASESASS